MESLASYICEGSTKKYCVVNYNKRKTLVRRVSDFYTDPISARRFLLMRNNKDSQDIYSILTITSIEEEMYLEKNVWKKVYQFN